METIEYKGMIIKVEVDYDPLDPRQWDNLGIMVCNHRHYALGDKHNYDLSDYNSWKEVEGAIRKNEDAAVMYPLYLYDHTGLQIKIGSFYGLLPQGHAEYDSGQVGFIFVSKQTIRREYGVKRISKKLLEKVANILRSEVEVYDYYISGEVYGFKAVTPDGKEIDSCWGYYGDPETQMIPEAKASIDDYINEERTENNLEPLKEWPE